MTASYAIPAPSAEDVAALRARFPRAFGIGRGALVGRVAIALLAAAWLAILLWWFDVAPARLWAGLSRLGVILRQMLPPSWGAQWRDILRGLGESLAMAWLGTLAALVVAIPLGLLGARTVMLNRLAHFGLRRFVDAGRALDQLVWALAFVRAVGLGPLAGVLAIAAAEVFVLAKLFAEALENADPRQVEAVRAAGGSRLSEIRFGLIPQVLPVMVSQLLYQFESNVRSASILGVVGAGGIGLQISERIRVRYWDEVAFIILLILATVAAIDFASGRIRRNLIGARG